MKISDQLLKNGANNFTILRLFLASLVIYQHCYGLVSGQDKVDDLSPLLGVPTSTYAVDGFFFLSGFLVYPSLLRLESPFRFIIARLSRVWPGLAVSIILVALGGLAFSQSSFASYFDSTTFSYIWLNLTFMKPYYALSGVMCGEHLCDVNGSLWTLPWEIRCYLILAGLHLFKIAKPSSVLAIILPLTVLYSFIWDSSIFHDFIELHLGNSAEYFAGTFARLWTVFALGIAAYICRKQIPLSWLLCLLLLGLTVISRETAFAPQVRAVSIGYWVLCLGILTAKRRAISVGWPDYSYGVYIYAFPVMLALSKLWHINSYVLLAVLTFAFTLPTAAFSWHCVEKPALVAFRRFHSAKYKKLD